MDSGDNTMYFLKCYSTLYIYIYIIKCAILNCSYWFKMEKLPAMVGQPAVSSKEAKQVATDVRSASKPWLQMIELFGASNSFGNGFKVAGFGESKAFDVSPMA